MIICALTPDQIKDLRVYNIASLLDKVKNNEPFDLKQHISEIYQMIFDHSGDNNIALDYARLAVIHTQQAVGYDTDIRVLRKLGLDLGQLADLTDAVENPDTGLKTISDFLGLKEKPKKLKELVAKGKVIQEKKSAEEVETQITEENKKYRLKPETPFSTTISELIDNNNPDLGKDPQMQFFTDFIRKVFKKIPTTPGKGLYYGKEVKGGLFLSMVALSRIPDDQKPNKELRSDYVYVVTDKDGNFIQFNDAHEVVPQGRFIYYSTRPTDGSYTQSAESIAAKTGTSVEEEQKKLDKAYSEIKAMHAFLGKHPDQHLLFSIIDGSLGGTDTRLKDSANLKEKIKPSSVKEIADNVRSLRFNSKPGSPWSIDIPGYPSELFISTKPVDDDRVDMLVQLFINDVDNLTAFDKAQFLRDLFGRTYDYTSDLKVNAQQGSEKGYSLNYKDEEIFFMDQYGNPDFKGRSKVEVEAILKEAFSTATDKKGRSFRRRFTPVFGFITEKTEVKGTPQFKDIVLTEEDGIFTAKRVPMSSIDYMDMTITIDKANVEEDGTLVRYNPYFTPALFDTENNKIEFGPVEEETVPVVPTSVDPMSDVESFETSKGSVYTVLPNGKTQRYKTATKEQNEPNDLIVFVKFKNVEQEQDFLSAQNRQNGQKLYVIDSDGNIYDTNEQIKGKDVKLAIIKDGKVIETVETSIEPKIGYNTFDQRRYEEKGEKYRSTHLGNKVVKINYKKPAVTSAAVESLRAAEQAEYDAMSDPTDEVAKKEIYDRYDKLITPLLKTEEIVSTEVVPAKTKKKAPSTKKVTKKIAAENKVEATKVVQEEKETASDEEDMLAAFEKSKENIEFLKKQKGLNSLLEQKDVVATAAQILEAKSWWDSHPLSKFVGFKEMFEAVNHQNKESIATWTRAGITLYRGADYSDLYHEAWHAFTQLFMTKQQKAKLYNELRKTAGSFTSYQGRVVEFSKADIKELEEYLAQDFRNFMLTGKVAETAPVRKSIFQWLLDVLKQLFGISTAEDVISDPRQNKEILRIYNALSLGNEDFKKYTFDESNVDFSILESNRDVKSVIDESNVAIARNDSRKISQSIDGILIELIDTLNARNKTKSYSTLLFTSSSARSMAYNIAYRRFSDSLKNTIKLRSKSNEELIRLNTSTKPTDKKALKDYLEAIVEEQDAYDKLNYKANMLSAALANFGDPSDLDNPKGVIKYHMEFSDLISPRDKFFDNELDTTIKNEFDRFAGNERSIAQLASPSLLYSMKALYEHDENGEPAINELGFRYPAPFASTRTRLLNVTENAFDAVDIYAKLAEAAEDYPVVKQFVDRIGEPSNSEPSAIRLWADIEQAFLTERIGLRMIRNEQGSKIDEAGEEYQDLIIRQTKSTAEYKKVGQAWNKLFQIAPESDTIDTDDAGINSLNIQTIYEKYNDQGTNEVDLNTGKPVPTFSVDVAYDFLKDIGIVLEDSPLAKRNFELQRLNNVAYGTYKLLVQGILAFNVSKGQNKLLLRESDSLPIVIKKPEDIFVDYKAYAKANFRGELSAKERKETRSITSFLSGARKNWARLQQFQLKWSDEFSDTMVPNASGDLQYERSQRSSLTQEIKKLNHAKTLVELTQDNVRNANDLSMNHYSKNRNPWMKGSYFMSQMFNEAGRRKEYRDGILRTNLPVHITLENHAGYQTKITEFNGLFKSFGIDSAGSDEITKRIGDLIFMLEYGAEEATRHADKATTPLIKLENGKTLYMGIHTFVDDETMSNLGREYSSSFVDTDVSFIDQVVKYIASEYERIQKLKSGDSSGNVLVGDKLFKNVGNKFVVFNDLLKLTLSEKEIEALTSIKGVNDYDDFLKYVYAEENQQLKDKIEEAINEHRLNVTEEFSNKLAETGVLNNDNFKQWLFNKTSSSVRGVTEQIIDQFGETAEAAEDLFYFNSENSVAEDFIDSAIAAYVANSWIHKFEVTTMFYGDPALYTSFEDFFKRNAGVHATGELPVINEAMINHINKVSSGDNSWAAKNNLKVTQFGRTMNTAVMEDVKSKSVYLDTYLKTVKKLEKERLTKLGASAKTITESLKSIEVVFRDAYEGMKEADGQGYITFDAYRQLLMSLNKWSNEQDESYLKIINGEDVGDVTKIFPVKKLQYWGSLLTDGMPVKAFHKFSVFPLIPNAIKGSDLERLHTQMMKDGISYSTFLSGSKLNSVTKNGKVDKFYSVSDRSSNDLEINKPGFKFTPNTIFLDYLKDQLEVNDYYKGVVTFSSQMRKLVIRGMFENGIPVDWKSDITNKKERLASWKLVKDKNNASPLAAIAHKFNDILEKLVDIEKEKIREKAGAGKDFKKLVEYIKTELRKPGKDLSDNELDYIDLSIDRKKLLRDLDLSPSANLIEKALTRIAQKKILNQKLTGESLTQVSGVGFQAPGKLRKATKAEELKYRGTGGLRFYNPEFDANGNIVSVSSMQIKIAIQGPFKVLLKDREVLKRAEEKNITPLAALNDLIQDETWISKPENKKKITMVGVRIPVQGLNSMEVMEVAEFLPETAGPLIILPSEIVAKSGGDFDIDKMFTLFPSFFEKKLINNEAYKELSEELGYDVDFNTVQRVLKIKEYAEESDTDILTDEDKEILRKLDYYDLSEISVQHRKDKSKQSLQNDLIDTLSRIILHPNNFSTLVTPNTTVLMKGLARRMAKLTRDDDSKFSHLNIFETERNIFKQQSNNIGKTVLGIIAVVNTFNSIFGGAGVILDPTRVITEVEGEGARVPVEHRQTLLLDHNSIDGRISLSNLFDHNNINKIEDLISQLINGSVDVAKDAWLFDIQGNKEVINSLLFMIMSGVPADKAVYFVSQPIIREYVKKQREYKSNFSNLIGKYSKDEENMFRINSRNDILFDPKYGFDLSERSFVSKGNFSGRPEKGPIFKKAQEIADSVDFNDVAKLEQNIKEHEALKKKTGKDTYSDIDRAVFSHFLEIQEMANQVTQLTQSLNFDRSKTIDMLEARVKLHKLDELSNGISQDTINEIINNSPVASYKTNDFILELFGRNAGLFGLRDNPELVDYLISLTEKDESGIPPITVMAKQAGMDEADYMTAFKNNIVNYLFQRSLYKFDEGASSYKGYPIVKQDAPLDRGVFIKDGKMYMSPENIKLNFISKDYEKISSWSNTKAAKLKEGLFDMYTPEDGLRLYTKFLMDREILMNREENSFANISKTKEYKKQLKDLNKMLSKVNSTKPIEQRQTPEQVEIEARAYQITISNKALDQSNLHGHLFFGSDSYANQVMSFITKNPELRKAYPILSDLEVDTEEQEFDRADETLVVRLNRLKFKSVKPETSVLDDFADDLANLANPSVRKVKNKADNAAISELFSRFGTYVMLQTGMNTSSPFSMIRAVPSTMLYDTLEQPYKDFLKNLHERDLRQYQTKFDKQISKENPMHNKILNFESIDITLKEFGEKTITTSISGVKTYTGNITKLDQDQIFVFGSNPLGINGNTEKGTGGAALVATKKGWVRKDEIMDNTLSESGRAYGIVTVSAPGKDNALDPEAIIENIKTFYNTAKKNPDINYLVAYSAKGKNLNGYTAQEMADMFSAHPIPSNVVFEKGFANLLTLAEYKERRNRKIKSVDYVSNNDVIEFNKTCASKK